MARILMPTSKVCIGTCRPLRVAVPGFQYFGCCVIMGLISARVMRCIDVLNEITGSKLCDGYWMRLAYDTELFCSHAGSEMGTALH